MQLKKTLAVLLAASLSLSALGCGGGEKSWTPPANSYEYNVPQDYYRTYYEIFVRSFADGNGDGIGDFKGLIQNLDYLNDGDDSTMTDLGVNGIWLMPIHPTGSYHGYDVKDYKAVNPKYGTLDDFDTLVSECDKRGIWVQIDLVLNHTSKDHPWFVQALKDAKNGLSVSESAAMQRYEFYPRDEKPASGKYYNVAGTDYCYLANFDSSMPDLNLENFEFNGLKEEIEDIVDFWLEHGVRSFRLDAVPWACANSVSYNEANGYFWSWFDDYCHTKGEQVFGAENDGISRYCYNVGEVWSGSTAINSFFGTGMSAFNYTMGGTATAGFAAVAKGNRGGSWLVDQLKNAQNGALNKSDYAILSNFLSNHDNNRSAGFFEADPKQIKLAAALYLLAPGNPYIYYGEEIGALGSGDNNDPNKRLRFNWGGNSKYVTDNPPGYDFRDKQTLGSVKSQTNDPDSVLTFYREAIRLRNRFPEIARGRLSPLAVNGAGKLVSADSLSEADRNALTDLNAVNKQLAAFSLTWNNRAVMIVHNVSGASATVDMSGFDGYSIAGQLKSKGGSASLSGGKLKLSGGATAVLKAE